MNQNLISVIIPCQNGTNYLKEAIDSVKRQEMNTEIIVVDDGSTDDTANLARKCGVEVYSIPHSGLSVARNIGLKNAKGDFVLFLDHDDIMTENALKTLYNELMSDISLGYAQGKLKDFISPELNDENKKSLVPRKEPYGGLLTGAFLFKKSIFDIVGGFDESLKTGQGVDFMLRLNNAGGGGIKTRKIDFITTLRRLHNTNMGRTMQKQENKDYSTILRAKILARKPK